MASSARIESASDSETEAAGARLAQALAPGDVVGVAGELGAGKTTFVRGACRALGVTAPVTSPTYTIGHRYEGRLPVAHLDLYRLAGHRATNGGATSSRTSMARLSSSSGRSTRAAGSRALRATVTLAHLDPTHRSITIDSDDDLRL